MTRRAVLVALLLAMRRSLVSAQTETRVTPILPPPGASIAAKLPGDIPESDFPRRIRGVELTNIEGWFANRYPWQYLPEQSTVHPLSSLWQPGYQQSPGEIEEESRLLNEYGSGLDVLEYNPHPRNPDHNYWLSTYFSAGPGSETATRPFFLLYEHINGTRYIKADGKDFGLDYDPINMDLEYNRQVLRDDVDSMFRRVILPYASRYVTIDQGAVIYFWSVVQMIGDLASLLDELRAKYPVKFLGSVNVMDLPSHPMYLRNFKSLDGFMEYAMVSKTFAGMMSGYDAGSRKLRGLINGFRAETGRNYLFIPTFQAGFDDSKVVPKRNTPIMLPRSREELEAHGDLIVRGKADGTYARLGPFVVFNELFEGGAIIPSQCLPETVDTPGRFVGCGTGRIEVVWRKFGRRS